MLPLFLIPELPNSGVVEITGEEAQHAISALRIKTQELISLTNGYGARAIAQVVEVNKKTLIVEIQSYEFEKAPEIELVVAQALTKGDRARETVELLTQAGVARLIPWQAQRSVGVWKSEALQKWITWSKEATKQSRRSWIPEIVSAQSTSEIAQQISEFDLALIFQEDANVKLSTILEGKSLNSVLIIIGPEGGVTPEESSIFVAAGAIPVVMGKPVFRSAHAGAAALAAVQTALKIW